jgi:class 3 adenylate cyclase
MLQRLLSVTYRRTGSRYPLAVLAVAFVLQFGVFAAAIAGIALYLPVSLGQFAVLLLAGGVLQTFLGATSAPFFHRRLAPTVEWLRGGRGSAGAEAAWEAAASAPVEFFRLQIRKFAPAIYIVVWCSFAVWELHLPGYGLPILMAAAVPVFLFAIAVLFLLMERTLRPLLEELALAVPAGVQLEGSGIPLRARLLSTLPAMNVVAGIGVAGLAGVGDDSVGRLGLVVGISFAFALVLALALALLLSDSIVAPIARLHDATERVGRGDLTVEVGVISVDETGALTGSFNRMVTGLRERERLREAFGTFVDPELTERVLRDGTDLAGEEVDLSVLFMDLRGFTSYSEQAQAHDVVARLNDLYGHVVPVILAHGGHANKFIGDGLLAVFGAPVRLSDHADRAAAAAVEIARIVNDRYAGELRVGIGVNSGRVIVGTIGGGGRLDFTVIGDPVNTAARVESATRQTGDDILITAKTRDLLTRHDIAQWDERPPIPLKGKTESVTLYAPAREPAQTVPIGTTDAPGEQATASP